MNILVIGGAGYIGGVTTHLAVEAGHDVTVFDDLSTGHQYNLPKKATFIRGDVRDRQAVKTLFKNNYGAVMHFAARIVVPESVEHPYDYFEVNSFGALNCIDEAAKAGVGQYIFSSSAAVYGAPGSTPITEDAQTKPVNPYGSSKLVVEQILHSYHLSHKLPWVALRYFNVAGAYAGVGTDYPFLSHIVPRLLDAMAKEQPFTIFGNDYNTPDGTCVRDYVHVADIARAHLLAAGIKDIDQPINLASHQGFSVKEVVDTFNKVTKHAVPIQYGRRRPGDPERLVASNERAKKMLGWSPRANIAAIIRDHYDWYQQKR